MVSLNRIRSIVSPLLGIQLSETTILNYVNRLAGKVKGTVDAILEAQKGLSHVHCDETGATVNGKSIGSTAWQRNSTRLSPSRLNAGRKAWM